ncbi:MAG: peptidoglycan bridge formation glycyltransferase FemA/FemB family protein, partial [Anaerolineales bacterium]|nr:peptidoglycan bridge formation glycyltransferase FemA/FemB family protein [Anaerolineales bacterium]
LKKGVEVYRDVDVAPFYRLMTLTGERDAFEIHSLGYYRSAIDIFAPRGRCALFYARYQGEILAGLMAFAHGQRAWYFYGASSDQQRQVMAPYLLQWEAMRWARQQGCRTYDLWGVPDYEREVLEGIFTGRSDGLWGVYRFKRGFGGALLRSAAAQDRVYSQPLYQLYRWWVGRRETQT